MNVIGSNAAETKWLLKPVFMRKLLTNFDGHAKFFDYCITHTQLLLRCSRTKGEKYYNTDFLFDAVFYLQTVTDFDGPFEIYEGDEDDKRYISSVIHKEAYWQLGLKVYIITQNGKEYFIGAASLKIDRNDLPVDQTSIAMKKDWYMPTTAEEVKARIEMESQGFEDYMQKM